MPRLILTTLFIIAAGIFLLLWDSPPEAFLAKSKNSTHEELPSADGYMLDTKTVKYNTFGVTSYTLDSDKIDYFRRGSRFTMNNPAMFILDSNNPLRPWQINAKRGDIVHGGKKITLTGDVYAWQSAMVTHRNELLSPQLVFFTDKHTIESSKRVTVTTPFGKTSGTGMWADLRQERFKLLSKVKGVHHAQR